MKKAAIWMMMVVFVAGATFLKANANGQRPKDGNADKRIEKLFEKLPSLTDDQKVKIKAIHEKSKSETKPLRDQVKQMKSDLKAIVEAESVDLAKADLLIEQVGTLKIDLERMHLRTKMEIDSILTPAQREELKRFRQERHQKRKQ